MTLRGPGSLVNDSVDKDYITCWCSARITRDDEIHSFITYPDAIVCEFPSYDSEIAIMALFY